MDLDLRLLRHAHVLADLGSFARAARALGITQPALSRSIKTLESRIGARLFARSATGAGLTDAGQLFLKAAHELLMRADELAHQAEFLRGIDSGSLGIGSGPYRSELVIAQSVARMSQKTRMRFRVVVSDPVSIVGLFEKRELDLAIVEAVALSPDGRIIASASPHSRVERGWP